VNRNPNAGRDGGALPSFALDPIGSTGNTSYARAPNEGGDEFGRMLGSVSGALGEWTAASARADAEEAGAMAGLDPAYHHGEGGPLLANAAYHAAALKTHSRVLDTKMRAAQEEALTEWERLPQDQRSVPTLQKALEDRKKLMAADVFDDERPGFETSWGELSRHALVAADRDVYKRTLDEAKAATLAHGETISGTAHRVASLPTASDADVSRQVADYERTMDEAVNQGQMTAVQAQEQKSRFRQSVLATRTLSLFDGLPPGERAGALEKFRGAYGGGDYFSALRQQETGGDDTRRPSTSTAQGRYQFTNDTWRDVMRAHPELGLTADGRADAAQQEKAVRAFTADNAAILQKNGLAATPGNLYMAHFMGAAGATQFLRALEKNPNASAASLFPEEAKANPAIFNGRTVGDVYALQTRRFEGSKTAGLTNDNFNLVVGHMEQRVRADAHLAEATQRAAFRELADVRKRVTSGDDPSPEEWSRVADKWGASADPDVRLAFDRAARSRATLSRFKGQSPQQVEAEIASMQAKMAGGKVASHMSDAAAAMKLTPQERALYDRHFANLTGPGGVNNPDGSRSTLFATTVNIDGREYVLPTVYDGKKVSVEEAVRRAQKEGLDKFPSYADNKEASARYDQLHSFMEKDTADYLASSGGAPEEVELVEDAKLWLASYRKDVAEDPVARFSRDLSSKIVRSPLDAYGKSGAAVAPLAFDTPEAFAASLTSRVPVADQAAKVYGLPFSRLLTQGEKATFKTLAANGGPQMVAYAAAAMKTLGARGTDFLREIGGDAPAFAQAARVAAWGGEKGFIDDFAEWHRLSSDPATRKALELPKREPADMEMGKALGQSLAALPDLAGAVRTAAVQTYEVRALRNGWDRTLNDGAAREALQRATQEALGATFVGDAQFGGVAARRMGWMGGQQVLAPGNLRADKFDDALAAITDADLKANPPLHSENRPASAATVKGGWLLSVGRGKYEVYDRDPLSKDARPLRAKDGAPWVLDLNAMEERLRPRVPGAWK
jgi:hypothetical protein